MKITNRLSQWALSDPLFPNHMSFITGPRQCGKTTLALHYLKQEGLSKELYYFNWDRSDVRRRFKQDIDWISTLALPKKRPTLVFDEIHKVRQWKRLLKGVYDQYKDDFQFIVTGSGRLDHYQRGGDSLAGRYDPYCLFPFTPGEIEKKLPLSKLKFNELIASEFLSEEVLHQWESLGGFPEPFLSGVEGKAKAWWKQYQLRVTEEDLKDLTRLESVDLMRDILHLLPSKISSPLSLQSIREDVETSFATVKRYVSTLNQLFLIFEVAPYSKKIHRAVKKEKKIYFYHHPAVLDKGARFENMVALILKRWVSEQVETANGDYELCYLRDQDRREVDFMITLNQEPHLLIEAKCSETALSPSLRYYSEKLKVPGLQIVRTPKIRIQKEKNLAVLSIHALANALG
jgi:predicted AAA+ superfamily ATPase